MKRLLLVFSLVLAMALPSLAADSTSLFNEKVLGTKIEKASAGGGVPVGTVIAWPANSNPEDPENWLECNGQGISHSVYPELYAVVGGSVPDYQGYFLRGVGGNSAGLGQAQGDEVKKHKHGITLSHEGGNAAGDSSGFPNTDASGPFAQHMDTQPDASWSNSSGAGNPIHSFGGSENRPVNKAVRYLIRAKP